jgi:hypothetical protein
MRRAMTLTCATAALVVGGAATASAAPPEREPIPLVCDNGETYEVVVNGNGAFTPGNIVDSTGVFVPTAFGAVTFHAETPTGEVTEFTEPPTAKGAGEVGPGNRPSVTCTVEVHQTLAEEEDGLPAGTEITISGEVTGFLTGRP